MRIKNIIKLLTGIFKSFTKKKPTSKIKPAIIPRKEHTISRKAINPNALKVLYRLNQAGFAAFLVGGCVRDLLLDQQPKDFDVATDAHPEEVRQLFRNCRLIGKRFRLAHVLFGRDIIEVATFRTHHENAHETHGHTLKGRIIRDNVYGAIEDDVWRRDFRINALYYNIADFSIVDYTGGMQDIYAKSLTIIGDPVQRYHEDPVRMLRAIRFMGKLNLDISPETEKPIMELSHLLTQVSPARIFQEVLKMFQEGATLPTFKLLQKYHLLTPLFPQTAAALHQTKTQKLLEAALSDTDKRMRDGKSVSPAFLFAAFLWHPILQHATEAEDLPVQVAFDSAISRVLKEQIQQLALTRHLQVAIRDICYLQHRFLYRQGARPFRLLEHPRFRAAYDLLMLRARAGEPVQEIGEWWTEFQFGTQEQRELLLKDSTKKSAPKKRTSRVRSNRKRKPKKDAV